MAVTKDTVSSKIKELAKNSIHATVLEGKEDFELYNALVGTTFDAESYDKVANDAPEYLFDHIPSGSKMISEKKSEVDVEEVEPTVPTTPTESTTPTDPTNTIDPSENIYVPDLNNLEDAEDAVLAIQDAIENGGMTAETDPGMDLNKDGVIDEKDLKIAQDAVERLKG